MDILRWVYSAVLPVVLVRSADSTVQFLRRIIASSVSDLPAVLVQRLRVELHTDKYSVFFYSGCISGLWGGRCQGLLLCFGGSSALWRETEAEEKEEEERWWWWRCCRWEAGTVYTLRYVHTGQHERIVEE